MYVHVVPPYHCSLAYVTLVTFELLTPAVLHAHTDVHVLYSNSVLIVTLLLSPHAEGEPERAPPLHWVPEEGSQDCSC